MSSYIADAAFVKVSIGSPSGNRVAALVRRGETLPEGVVDEQIERLLEQGFISEAPDAEEAAAEIQAALDAQKAADDDAYEARVKEGVDKALAERDAAAKKAAEASKAPATTTTAAKTAVK